MLQFAAWMIIYSFSIKLMTKNAGRNSPAWGLFFVLISFPMMFVSGVILALMGVVYIPLFTEIIILIFNAIFTLSLVFLLSICVKKNDLSKREKKTKVNYKISAVFIGIIGLVLLIITQDSTGKPSGWLMTLIGFTIAQSLDLYRRSKVNADLTISDFKEKPFVLFLRSFNSTKIKSKSMDSLVYSLDSGMVEEYIGALIPPHLLFVTIGNPEDYLPSCIGAKKIYTDNDLWKKTVSEYMDLASNIIILEGETIGLLWELKYIKDNISPSKVVVVTYPDDYRESKSYLKNISYIGFIKELYKLGINLPSYDVGANSIISFDRRWNVDNVITGKGFITEYLMKT